MKYFQNDKGQYCSTSLMDQMYGVPVELGSVEDKAARVSWLIKFIKDIELIEYLGYLEHTGDWDPFIIIKLKNGEQIETQSGYYDIEIKGGFDITRLQDLMESKTIVLQFTDTKNQEEMNWEDEELTHEFELSEIESIMLLR